MRLFGSVSTIGFTMLSTHWDEVKSVFEVALLLDEEEQDAFVRSRCQGDFQLAQEVLRLLAADRKSSSFLEGVNLSKVRGLCLETNEERLTNDDVLCSRFRVLAYLGEGGMGRVYKAIDLELRQDIAIKVIRREIANAPGMLSRFKREVSLTRKVTHPNVCRTFDLEAHLSANDTCVSAAPITFITMELLVGETLAERLHRTGPLREHQLRELAKQVAEALHAAHSAGVVHCDLKPSNIFLSGSESAPRIVVTDFGVARFTHPRDPVSSAASTTTDLRDYAAAGTPSYMAPEQFETGDCSPASDLYSFGLVLYEAMTAQKLSPFRRSLDEIETALRNMITDPATEALQPVKPVWTEIIARCVQPDPARRFDNAQQVINLLTAGSSKLLVTAQSNLTAPGNAHVSKSSLWLRSFSAWKSLPWAARVFALSVIALALIVRSGVHRSTAIDGIDPARTSSSVAVLPFVEQGTDGRMDAVARNIALNLTDDLAQVSGLRVPSQSVVRDLGKTPDVALIRRKLNADVIVNGSIVNAGNDPMLQIELVDVHTGLHLWGQSYTSKEMQSPSLADDIAQDIAYQLQRRNEKSSLHKRPHPHSNVPAAESAFVQGQSALAEHTYAGFERSVRLFQQALDADPNYAEAMAALSRSYTLMAINNGLPEPPVALMSQAESKARQALRIDSTSAAAYTSLAQVAILRDYNWDEAEDNFKRAEEVDPEYIPAHVSYALHLLTARGRFAEARAQLTYADTETPRTLGSCLTSAVVAYFSRKYDDSVQQIKQIRNQFHTSGVAVEVEALDYLALDAPSQALKVLLAAPPDPSAVPELREALRGIALAQMGQRQTAMEELKRLDNSEHNVDSSYYIAALCAQLGYRDKAMRYLEKSYQNRQSNMLFLGVDPLMDPLRPDPRFKSMLARLNLL